MKSVKRVLAFLMIGFLADGCIVMYSTFDVPVNQTTFRHYQDVRPKWTIQSDTVVHDVFVNRIDADKFVLTVAEGQRKNDHPTYTARPNYWRRFGRFTKDNFHLHVGKVPTETGAVEIPFTAVTAARTHQVSFLTVPASLLVTAAGMGAFLLVACNCPQVMVMGPEGGTRAGALFPGAMSKSLERQDNLLLHNVPLLDGKVTIKLFNELPETEYIDQVALYELRDLPYSNIATHDGAPVAYNNARAPLAALNGNGSAITEKVIDRDSVHYDFDEVERFDDMNKVYLRFRREAGDDRPLLVVNAKQSRWIETVGEYFFAQFGNKFDTWVDRLDKVDPIKYNKNLEDRGISLNAYMKVKGDWKHVGSFANVGTQALRMMALPLELEEGADEVEVKLESAFGLWELDYAGLASKWSPDIEVTRLQTLSAVNQSGVDVSAALSTDDQSYAEQPAKTSFVDLKFEAPSRRDAVLMLSGNGYYHHERNYTNDPNKKLLREWQRNPIATHQLSRGLRAQLATLVSASAGNK
jgi:hypothetical protein